jgi:hypothetical protein
MYQEKQEIILKLEDPPTNLPRDETRKQMVREHVAG